MQSPQFFLPWQKISEVPLGLSDISAKLREGLFASQRESAAHNSPASSILSLYVDVFSMNVAFWDGSFMYQKAKKYYSYQIEYQMVKVRSSECMLLIL